MRGMALVLCVFLQGLHAACSGTHPSGWAGTFQDSAGVTLVRNTAEGIWSEAEGWHLVEELRIGGLSGDAAYQFGQVGAIAVDSQGRIFVSDVQAQEVRVFSPVGEWLRTLGRPGSGPGELGFGASVLLISPGDTLLVPDLRNRRINRFGPAGEDLPSAPLEPEKGRPLRFDLGPSGGMTVQIRPVGSSSQAAAETWDALVSVEPSGALGDTLLRFPSGGLFQGPGIHYFTPEPLWEVADSATVVLALNSEFRIRFYRHGGKLERVLTAPFEPARLTERDLGALFGYLDRAWLDAGVPPGRLETNRRSVHFAEFLPVIASIHTGYHGSLWVQRVQAPGLLPEEEMERYDFVEDFGSTEWDVFDGEGRYLGMVRMPDRFAARLFLGDRIYGVWRDELDVPYVLRLRVVDE